MVEAKHFEVLKDTQATISCGVTGLTKKLNAVTWQKPLEKGTITDGMEGFKIVVGAYDDASNSQTTILTIPAAKTTDNFVYTCTIQSDEHGKEAKIIDVDLDVLRKYANSYRIFPCSILFCRRRDIQMFFIFNYFEHRIIPHKFLGPVVSSFDLESGKVIEHRENQGILALFHSKAQSNKIRGTVCAPNFDYYMADFFCGQLGNLFGEWARTGERPQYIQQQ